MHAGAWLDRLAANDGEPRDRLLAALAELGPDAATVFTPLAGEPALLEAGILAAPMTDLEARWRAAIEPDPRRTRPADAATGARSGARPARPRRGAFGGCGASSPRSGDRTRGDLVSEIGVQVGVARIRAGAARASPAPRDR